MSGDRDLHARASAMFLEMRDLPRPQREQRLGEVEAALRREVISLLAHDDAMTLGQDATRQAVGADPAARSSDSNRPSSSSDLPERIGPYRVIQRIGRGGSGFVMLAEQDQPVQRRVAIKIVPHAALDPEFAARFEVERRALERTDHPNIARILDAGRTADGLPYLVMDYVQGVNITEYCRGHALGLLERINLILDIADAVQHAHQRGVIHRDLKPANILVSEHAGADGLKPVCRPRVLDFGIAKPIPEMFGSDSPPTVGLPLGTPAYMAPEQTGGAGSTPIDTRADVYALGAVLYELTCGRPPNDVTEGDPLRTLRNIRETVPPPASRVRAEAGSEFAADAVPRSMMTDLDCALARALEKDPARRYPTISALADDLRRLLRREPIEARPATRRYRAARFVQRNRVLVTSLAMVALAMLVGVAGLVGGLVEARRQRREADNQTEAQREINQFLTDDLLAAASPEEEGGNITALQLLHRAAARVESRFANRPLIAASIHHTLGVAFSTLGALDDADRHLQRSIALRTAAAGPNAPETVRSEIAAASLLARQQRLDEADRALTQAIERSRLLLPGNDSALLSALNDLGTLRETQDRADEAVALLQEALAGRIQTLGPRDPQVFMTMSNLAMAYERQGDGERALNMQVEALRIAETLQPPPRLTLLGLNNNVGATYQDLNRDIEAEPYLRRAAELAQDFLGAEHPDTLTIKANLASLEAELGNVASALGILDEIVRIRTRDLGPAAYDTLMARYAYWNVMYKSKRFGEAADGYTAMLPDAITGLRDGHWFVAQVRSALALALLDANRPREALPHAEMAVTQFTAVYGPDHDRTRGAANTLRRINARLGAAVAAPAAAPATQPATTAQTGGAQE